MKSPFPGMDPYLEQHWGDVHTTFMVYAKQQLNAQLPPDLQARVEETLSVEAAETKRLIYPDVRVVETAGVPFESVQHLFSRWGLRTGQGINAAEGPFAS